MNENEIPNFQESAGPVEHVSMATAFNSKVEDKQHGDLSLTEQQEQVKAYLEASPRMPFMIPLESGEVKGEAYRSVTLNGFRIEIKKGYMVNLPMPIFQILFESMDQESAALHDHENNLRGASAEKRAALG